MNQDNPSNLVQVDRAQLAELLAQNKAMKELISRGAFAISNISALTGGSSNLLLAVPKVIRQVQNNPEILSELQNLAAEFSKFLPDGQPDNRQR